MNVIVRTVYAVDNVETGMAARIRRENRCLSLRLVAKRMGISAMYLSHLERGKRAWTQARLDQFVDAVNRGG
ncbi:MAG: helix-turn-helix transcriptional regulator [Verrucomicrobiales bacterium]|nr:helix-turn-helix transcriptional regulator [Verrucomicrobiales bacterium]